MNNLQFSLWNFYKTIGPKGHEIKSCKLEVLTEGFGPAWMGYPWEYGPPQVHISNSFSITSHELAESLRVFTNYSEARQI